MLAGMLKQKNIEDTEQRKAKQEQQKDVSKAILEGLISGELERTPEGQKSDVYGPSVGGTIRPPRNIGEAIMRGLGGKREDVGYRRSPGYVSEGQMKRELLKREYETVVGQSKTSQGIKDGLNITTPSQETDVPAQETSAPAQGASGQYEMVQTGIDKYGNPEYEMKERPEFKTSQEVSSAMSKKKGEELGEKFGQMSRVVGAFRNLIAHKKRAEKEFGPLGAKAAFMYDVGRMRYAPSSLKKRIDPLQTVQAQTEEVSIGMLPIISGQARYIESLGERIKRTVPSIDIVSPTYENLVAQSVRNMMTLGYGVMNGYLTEESLRNMGIDPNSSSAKASDQEINRVLSGVKLTPAQEKTMEEAIKYTLDAPMIESYGKNKTDITQMSTEELQRIAGGQ